MITAQRASQLQQLLDDPDIENIDINGFAEVWVTYVGGRKTTWPDPIASSTEHPISLIQILGGYARWAGART